MRHFLSATRRIPYGFLSSAERPETTSISGPASAGNRCTPRGALLASPCGRSGPQRGVRLSLLAFLCNVFPRSLDFIYQAINLVGCIQFDPVLLEDSLDGDFLFAWMTTKLSDND